MTDNALVTIYPMGEEWVASTETDIVSTFDPETLEIKERFNHSLNVAVNMATAHAMVNIRDQEKSQTPIVPQHFFHLECPNKTPVLLAVRAPKALAHVQILV